jgi:hypothetical protein
MKPLSFYALRFRPHRILRNQAHLKVCKKHPVYEDSPLRSQFNGPQSFQKASSFLIFHAVGRTPTEFSFAMNVPVFYAAIAAVASHHITNVAEHGMFLGA